MKILLDTHCWLWMLVTPQRLSDSALELVGSEENELYLSAASSWEITIKWSLGKLPLPVPPSEYVPSRMAAVGVLGLPIEHSHALEVGTLPPLHRDPFDRLLIAQARVEQMFVLTADPQFKAYDVELVPAV